MFIKSLNTKFHKSSEFLPIKLVMKCGNFPGEIFKLLGYDRSISGGRKNMQHIL